MIHLRLSAVGLAILIGCTGYAYAACGPGKVRTYRDISGVRYVRTGCFGTCPSYEVFIWRLGLYYVGRLYVQKTGTYEAAVGNLLVRARELLKAHHFYDLNDSESYDVTDVPNFILAVNRCRVTTKLDWPDYEERPDITSLFDDLDALVQNVKWHKTSDSTDSPAALFTSIP